jgi:hypothetical protein
MYLYKHIDTCLLMNKYVYQKNKINQEINTDQMLNNKFKTQQAA